MEQQAHRALYHPSQKDMSPSPHLNHQSPLEYKNKNDQMFVDASLLYQDHDDFYLASSCHAVSLESHELASFHADHVFYFVPILR